MAWLRSGAEWFDARRRRIAFLLTGWLGLMLVSSGRSSDDTEWVAIPDLSWLLAAALGLSALAGLITLIVVRPSMKTAPSDRRRLTIRNVIVTLLVLVALTLILDGQEILEDTSDEDTAAEVTPGDIAAPEETTIETTADSGDIAALLLIAALAAAALAWSRSHPPPLAAREDHPIEPPLEEQLTSAVDDATEILLHGSNPREAVLAAYATLEHALARQNRGRTPVETPTEHMARVLRSIPELAEPAVQLGGLYELARFSESTITTIDQHEAADALDRARRQLPSVAGDRL